MTSHPISGYTRVYAHFAYPSEHVRTPGVFNAYFRRRGIDAVCIPVKVAPAGLAAAVAMCRSWENLAGIGVTMPHKETIAGLLDERTEGVRRAGASNVIKRLPDGRLLGGQLDGYGFVHGLKTNGFDPAGSRALLLGAGGSARAVAMELALNGIAALRIANRSRDRAEALAADVRREFPELAVSVADASTVQDATLIVNTTSVGMKPDDPLPVDLSGLTPQVTVADIIMKPEVTPLLEAARERGCAIHPGLQMLVGQLDVTAEWLDLAPAREAVGDMAVAR
ncbi:shikimate dehydrogenase [Actinoplanes bogorensis]|uniref:shikimate dehydrogenase (NADP(+)) n=1 Tax=Paractinoplanes bogorensis TaxID=1610840 RepID=A0ABS5YZM0_9ACTN|nr:shikimate dehydrogenase [Actinoplanes bogorensis]MBU2668893.1 shikimate dehydrogenase [Actinoplanes bogorensis]